MTKKILIVKHTSFTGDDDLVVIGQFTSKDHARAYLATMQAAEIGDSTGPDKFYTDEDYYQVVGIDFAALELDPEPNIDQDED